MAKKQLTPKLEKELMVQNEIRDIAEKYIENKIETMLETINERQTNISEELSNFASSHTVPCKWDRDGSPIEYEVKFSPLVINNMFFKPIVPMGTIEPQYNGEKLALVYEYYCSLLAEVNDKIGSYPSSLNLFCRVAGISLTTLRKYRNSSDLAMRTIVEKIYDQVGDENLTMSQLGIAKERSTLFKMRSQNELVEKAQPSVHINIVEQPNMEQINSRIAKYQVFANKKGGK